MAAMLSFLVLIDPLKEKMFLKILERGDIFDLSDYGDIKFKGWGEPTKDMLQEMHDKYDLPLKDNNEA